MALQRIRASSAVSIIDRVISDPVLATAVRSLEPAMLGALVDRVGLEDAGALLSLCSREQIEALFDDDLWADAGDAGEERLDPERFAVWLFAMGEAGEEHLVRRLVDMSPDLLTLAVHRTALVVDADAMIGEASALGGDVVGRDQEAPTTWDNDLDAVEKALDSNLCEQLDEFLVIARDPVGFDRLWPALVALDRDHSDVVRGVLERCAAMTAEETGGLGGLVEALAGGDALEAAAGGDRDDRRAARGHISAADARAFLKLAAEPGRDLDERDAITAAYLRALEPRPAGELESGDETLRRLLDDVEIGGRRAPALTDGSGADHVTFLAALSELGERDPDACDQRRVELTYLANVLVAGHRPGGKTLRPLEALELAARTCAAGLASLAPGLDAAGGLARYSADRLFRAGWPSSCPTSWNQN